MLGVESVQTKNRIWMLHCGWLPSCPQICLPIADRADPCWKTYSPQVQQQVMRKSGPLGSSDSRGTHQQASQGGISGIWTQGRIAWNSGAEAQGIRSSGSCSSYTRPKNNARRKETKHSRLGHAYWNSKGNNLEAVKARLE